MKLKLWLFPLFGIYLLLVSATTIKIEEKSVPVETQLSAVMPATAHSVKVHKLNFFQKLVFKLFVSKNKQSDTEKADKLASTSLGLGLGAFAILILGLFVPYVILGTVPLGIAAMITGSSALRGGTSQTGKAKTGKAFGLGSLITLGVLLILAAIVIAAWANSW